MLASIAVAAGIIVFIWTIAPTFKQKVKKDPYPVRSEYPAPVAVSLSDLNLHKATPVLPQKEIVTEPENVRECIKTVNRMAKKPIITSFLPESGTARYCRLKCQYYQNQTQTDRNQSDIRQPQELLVLY